MNWIRGLSQTGNIRSSLKKEHSLFWSYDQEKDDLLSQNLTEKLLNSRNKFTCFFSRFYSWTCGWPQHKRKMPSQESRGGFVLEMTINTPFCKNSGPFSWFWNNTRYIIYNINPNKKNFSFLLLLREGVKTQSRQVILRRGFILREVLFISTLIPDWAAGQEVWPDMADNKLCDLWQLSARRSIFLRN